MSGLDITPDGAPPEAPEAAADTAYTGIPSTLGQALGEEAGSTLRSLGRVAEQGQYQGSSWLAQSLYGMGADESAMDDVGAGAMPQPGSVAAPMMAPQEYNGKYAPIGDDGKPVSLGDTPMPEPVAKLVGQAKSEEIERENVVSRFDAAHGAVTNFAAGTVGFLLDPLRAASLFVPGIGEEALAARLGEGLLARTGARLAAGAVSGAIAQAPVSTLQYALGTQEDSDYGLRDAFRDMAFGAAGGAILHAGFGSLGDLGRWRRGEAQPGAVLPPELPDAAPILEAPAPTQHAAMGAAVAQLADGRPVDVAPFFYRPPVAATAVGQTLEASDRAELVGVEPTVEAQARRMAPDLYGEYDPLLSEAAGLRSELADPEGTIGAQVDDQVAALRGRAEELRSEQVFPPEAPPEEVRQGIAARTAEFEDTLRQADDLQAQRSAMIAAAVGDARVRLHEVDLQMRDLAPRLSAARRQAEGVMGAASTNRAIVMGPARVTVPEIATQQRALYRDGFAPGVSGDDLRQATDEVYGKARPETPQGAAGAPEATGRPAAGGRRSGPPAAPGEAAEGEAPAPGVDEAPAADPEMADAERRLAAAGELLPEEQDELERVRAASDAAEFRAAAYHEAAACLAEGGS